MPRRGNRPSGSSQERTDEASSRAAWGVAAAALMARSHVLTPRGLPLAWPLRRSWRLPLCRAGSPAETVLVAALAGAAGLWLLRHHLPLAALAHGPWHQA